MAEPPLPYAAYQYGAHELQRVGVWDLDGVDPRAAGGHRYWIIYIHGGAWRDPRVTHRTFEPSIERIRGDAFAGKHVAAFASIDYRLSPHPDFPQDPDATPPEQYRGARHPDHLDDVYLAVRYLQDAFGFGSRYILVGHSAGATLSYQMIATDKKSGGTKGKDHLDGLGDFVFPTALCGVEGIYDFRGLNDRKGGDYSGFLTAAFGDPAGWDAAAPMKCGGTYAASDELWVLAHSSEDELVDMPETEGMARRLLRDSGSEKQILLIKDLEGKHDDVWRSNEGVARVVSQTLRYIERVS
ncbi:alpha/beta-hydrolase [Hypoxylon sp. FL1150]|nr:alpha/beta-hydrolase [Hypoxylon sp. FL1150]